MGLLMHPSELAKVRKDPSLIDRAIDEALRWESPDRSVLFRVATRDVDVDGVTIPEGAGVIVCIGSANHDESVFPEPERFDVTRPSSHHMAFSHGPHTCLGRHVARAEIEVLLDRLLTLLPNLRVDPDKPPPIIQGTANRSSFSIPVVWD